MSTEFEGFTKERAIEVFGRFTGEEIRVRITDKLQKLIEADLAEFFKREAAILNMDALKKVGMPHLMLRIITMRIILDNFAEALGDNYGEVLFRIGEDVGFSFSIDLMRYLRSSRKIPLSYSALLEFWSIFDSFADWGKIRADIEEDKMIINISIKDSFLTRDYLEDTHRHCKFIEGYLYEVIDGLFLQWYDWIQKSVYRPPKKSLRVKKVSHTPAGQNCDLMLYLMEDNTPTATQSLLTALEKFTEGDYSNAILNSRKALERALKYPLELEDDFPVSFGRLLKSYEVENVPNLTYSKWVSVYDVISRVAHPIRSEQVNSYQTVRYLSMVKELLNELKEMELTSEQKSRLSNRRHEYGIYRK